jgi:hypothetical protein
MAVPTLTQLPYRRIMQLNGQLGVCSSNSRIGHRGVQPASLFSREGSGPPDSSTRFGAFRQEPSTEVAVDTFVICAAKAMLNADGRLP